jgi:hypothetical protein
MAGVDDDANRMLLEHGTALADAVTEALPGWVVRCVTRVEPSLRGEAEAAGQEAAADVGPRLRALLTEDVDRQRSNPLALVRDAVRYPTAVLAAAGVPPAVRSGFDVEHFPDDPYGLVPMTWRDVDESLHEPGIIWGALKARASVDRHGA